GVVLRTEVVVPTARGPWGAGVEAVPLFTVAALELPQTFHQFQLLRVESDVPLFDAELLLERLPVGVVGGSCVGLLTGQGELEGRVDPFRGLAESLHRPDAVIVFSQDRIRPTAQVVQ